MATRRPTKEELLAAGGRTLPDVIAPGLKVLFCGINPGLYTAWVGHHFARPGNRFWKALHAGGFTPRVLDPSEEQLLLEFGCGITNVADRPSAPADELSQGADRGRPAFGGEGGALLSALAHRPWPTGMLMHRS